MMPDKLSKEELYEICTLYLGDVGQVANALRDCLKSHQDLMNENL